MNAQNIRKARFTNELYPGEYTKLEQTLFELTDKSSTAIQVIAPLGKLNLCGKLIGKSLGALLNGIKEHNLKLIIILSEGKETNTVTTTKDWATPLGIMETDKDFIKLLEKEGIQNAPIAFNESKIEQLLPFLQSAKIPFVPLRIPKDEQKDIAKIIRETAELQDKKVGIVTASNIVSYGPDYDFTPYYHAHSAEELAELHRQITKVLTDQKTVVLKQIITKKKVPFPLKLLTTTIDCAKHENLKGSLAASATSGIHLGDNIVTYASILYELH